MFTKGNSQIPVFDTLLELQNAPLKEGQNCILAGNLALGDIPSVLYRVETTGSSSGFSDVLLVNGNHAVAYLLLGTASEKNVEEFALRVDSVQDIAGFSGTQDDQQISLKGWHPNSDVGGGILYWDASLAKSNHNGGTIFSPTVPWTTTTADYLGAVGETDPSGNGCWVRKDITVFDAFMAGAKGDGATGDTTSIQALIDLGFPFVLSEGYTFISGALTGATGMRMTVDGTLKSISTIGSNPLIGGDSLSNIIIDGQGTIDGNSANVGAVDSPGIKFTNITDSRIYDIDITNCKLTTQPGIDGAGLWLEGGSDCAAIRVNADSNVGNGIVFGNMDDSYTESCSASLNTTGSGIAHTRGNRSRSINDRAYANDFSNITMNSLDSEVWFPVSRSSGYSGVNLGHDSEASDASRSKLYGGFSNNNNFEGVTITGSTDVLVHGTVAQGNGSNSGANNRYGMRASTNTQRCRFINVDVSGSKNANIYMSGLGRHSVIDSFSYNSDRVGILTDVANCKIRGCEVYNNNQLGGTNRAGIQLTTSADNTVISETEIYDNQGTPTQSWGIQATTGTHRLVNSSIKNHGVDDIDLSGGAIISVEGLQIGEDAREGTVTLTAGTTTVVTNDNARSANSILLLPRNSSAATLPGVYVSGVTKGVDFTISHNTAVATETFAYKIL